MSAAERIITTLHTKEIIDCDTGEIRKVENVYTKSLEVEPPYFKVYVESVCLIAGVVGSAVSVLMSLVKHINYNGNLIVVKRVRQDVAVECGCTEGHVKNTIKKLVDKGILRCSERTVYTVNPRIIAKGRWRDIRELQSAWITIEINNGTKKIVTSLGDRSVDNEKT